jgi:hypothetical protein
MRQQLAVEQRKEHAFNLTPATKPAEADSNKLHAADYHFRS